MKLSISILLCYCLLALSLQGQTGSNGVKPAPKDNMALCEAAFVLAIAAAAGWVVITLYGKCPSKKDTVWVYIDESKDGRATWKCIATNGPIVLNGTDPLEVYRVQLTDDTAFYRARVSKITP